jgi:hypothetical protein
VRAIVGRLSDLGIKELFKLLTSVRAEGSLELETPAGRATLLVRKGHICGEDSAPLVAAYSQRSGTFCFHPETVEEHLEWYPVEEFLARLEADARLAAKARSAAEEGRAVPASAAADDPLAELRDSLEDLPLVAGRPRVVVFTADPRPYRGLEVEWRKRGWDVVITPDPAWPGGTRPDVAIMHLPTSATLAGQEETWLRLVGDACQRRPRVSVLWVGGLIDARLRHRAIVAGVDFMIPAPAGDVGETAKWFREEVTLIAERMLTPLGPEGGSDAEAFREFFFALQADADPAEVRASLLRFAGTYFGRAVLLAVGDEAFESLGGYGFTTALPSRVPRGVALLEDAVVDRRGIAAGAHEREAAALANALGLRDGLENAQVFPILTRGECVAVFLGDRPQPHAGGGEILATLMPRVGGMIGL